MEVKKLVIAGKLSVEDAIEEVHKEEKRLCKPKRATRKRKRKVSEPEGQKRAKAKSKSKPSGHHEQTDSTLNQSDKHSSRTEDTTSDSEDTSSDSEDQPLGLKVPGKGYDSWPWKKHRKELRAKELLAKGRTEGGAMDQEAENSAEKTKAVTTNNRRPAKKTKANATDCTKEERESPPIVTAASDALSNPDDPLKTEANRSHVSGEPKEGFSEDKAKQNLDDIQNSPHKTARNQGGGSRDKGGMNDKKPNSKPPEGNDGEGSSPKQESKSAQDRKKSRKVIEAEAAAENSQKPAKPPKDDSKKVMEERRKRAREKADEEASQALLPNEKLASLKVEASCKENG